MVSNPRSKPDIDLPAPDTFTDDAERTAALILACHAIQRGWREGERERRRCRPPRAWDVPGDGCGGKWNGLMMGKLEH